MFERFLGPKIHSYIFFISLVGMAIGLPWSKGMMSTFALALFVNFLIDLKFKESLQQLKSNRTYLLFLAWYSLLIIGLFWSEDLKFGLHDIKVKVSIFVLVTTILARPILEKWQLYAVLIVFLLTMFVTSFLNIAQYNHWWGNRQYEGIRGMSLFANHIRYAMLVSMSVAVCIFFIRKEKKYRFIFLLLTLWFTYYVIYSQVLTGYITLAGVYITTFAFFIYRKSKWMGWSVIAVSLISAFFVARWIFIPIKLDVSKYQNLPEKTAKGNPYTHDFSYICSFTEDPMLLNVSRDEMIEAWNKRSDKKADEFTPKGIRIEYILNRYLAIEHSTLDAASVNQLSEEDIQRIQQGVFYPKKYTLTAPLHNLRFQINNMKNPNGHSLLQRLEYWKTSQQIIAENWIFGVGTGDVQLEFNRKYDENQSVLLPENRVRSHNQFFAIWIGVGIFGVLIFLALHFEFIRFQLKNFQLLGLSFIAICILAYFFEDSLETQLVVSFFGLFFGLTSRKYHAD